MAEVPTVLKVPSEPHESSNRVSLNAPMQQLITKAEVALSESLPSSYTRHCEIFFAKEDDEHEVFHRNDYDRFSDMRIVIDIRSQPDQSYIIDATEENTIASAQVPSHHCNPDIEVIYFGRMELSFTPNYEVLYKNLPLQRSDTQSSILQHGSPYRFVAVSRLYEDLIFVYRKKDATIKFYRLTTQGDRAIATEMLAG